MLEHNKNGLLSAAGDVNAMATNIITLLDNAPLRKKMALNNYNRILEKYTRDLYLGETKAFLLK